MLGFIRKVLKNLDKENKLDENTIDKLSKSFNYDKNNLMQIAKQLDEQKKLILQFFVNENGQIVFSKSDFELLMLIDEIKSIAKISKLLNISTKKLTFQIENIEKQLGQNILIRQKGAGKQGGTKLNDFGKQFLQALILFEEKLNENAIKYFNEHLKDFFQKQGE